MKHVGGLKFDEHYMGEQMELLDFITNNYNSDLDTLNSGDIDFDDYIKSFSRKVYKKQLRKMIEDKASDKDIEEFQSSYFKIKPVIKEYLEYRNNFKKLNNLPSPPESTGLTGQGKKKKKKKKKNTKKRGGKRVNSKRVNSKRVNKKKKSKTKKKR